MERLTRDEILDHAHTIAEQYDGNLTLRQLYYRFVATGLFPSDAKEYERLGSVLSNARQHGAFPLEWLLDRTREARPGAFTRDDMDIDTALSAATDHVKSLPWLIGRDRWIGQRRFVSVWVEKEALAGVFEEPCDELGVSWFVCRGYPSVSALWQWVESYIAAFRAAPTDGYPIESATILYFGDHDPDGLEIPESSVRVIERLLALKAPHLEVPRLQLIALTREQIEQYSPPPFPAKPSSSRFDQYVRKTGLHDAWELDALEPRVLESLIRESVADEFDVGIYKDVQDAAKLVRAEFLVQLRKPGWLAEALG